MDALLPRRGSLDTLVHTVLSHLHVGSPWSNGGAGGSQHCSRVLSDFWADGTPLIHAQGTELMYAGDYVSYSLASQPRPSGRHQDSHFGYGTTTPVLDAHSATAQRARRSQHEAPRTESGHETNPPRASLNNSPWQKYSGASMQRYIATTY